MAVCSIASVVVMGWFWLGLKPAPTRDIHLASRSSLTANERGGALPAAASSAAGATNSGARNVGEDPRCIIRTASSPEVADASAPDTADAETAAQPR